MERRRGEFGRNPGGEFKGVPGNFGRQKGWGEAFKRIGDWGVLNAREWVGFGKRQGVSDARPRDQFELQQVISTNLSIEANIAKQRAASARARTAPSPVSAQPPTGTTTPSTPKAAPKATPKQTKPKPLPALRKVPLKRGR